MTFHATEIIDEDELKNEKFSLALELKRDVVLTG